MGIVQRQSIQTSIISYAGVALGYVNFVLLYPRFLQPEEVGLVRVIISIGVLLSQFSMLGSSYTLQRYFPYFNNKNEKYYGFLTYSFLVALSGFILFGVVTWLGRSWFLSLFEDRSPLLNVFYAYAYPIAFLMMLYEVLYYFSRSLLITVAPIFIREVLLRVMQTFVLVTYLVSNISFNEFLTLFALTYVLHFIFLCAHLARRKEFIILTKIRIHQVVSATQIRRYSIFIYLSTVAAIYVTNIDTVFVSAKLGLDDAAVYAVAFFIGTLVIIPSRAMGQVVVPLVSEAWKQNDLKRIDRLYKQSANNQLIIGAYIVLLLMLNTKWVLQLLPPIYAQAELVVYIIAISRLIDMSSGINGEIILVSKHVRFNLATNFFLIVIATLAMIFFINWWGIAGAALAITVAYFFFNSIRILFLWFTYRMQPFVPTSAIALVVFAVIGSFGLLLPEGTKNFTWAFLLSAFVTLLYWGIVLRLRLSEEISALIEKRLGGKIF